MKGTTKKYLSVLIALCLVLTPLFGVFAADGAHITINWTNVPSSTINLETGELYTLELDDIFNEPNSSHTLTYSVTGANLGPQTHIAYPVKKINNVDTIVPTFVFTVANTGTYSATVRATCSDEDYAEFTVNFYVILASDGTPDQYGYDETDKSSVTVYVTISNDGIPIKGTDGTIMANLPVTVPYRDLDDYYGLDEYYRYGTTGGSGEYTGSTVIARPTALHLYLYLLENYYVDTVNNPIANPSEILDYIIDSTNGGQVYYMDDEDAYSIGTTDKAIDVNGNATSLYLLSFWGHDCNLMYFRNHVFPLMSPGWGATCDYALLSDGDVIEIAMFSDWGFYSDGAFLRFCGYDKYASCSIGRDQTLNVSVQEFSTASMGSGSYVDTTDELMVTIYSSDGSYYDDFTWAGNSSNDYSYQIASDMPTGLYYVVAMDPDAGTDDACMAPAVMTVIVY